MFICFSYRKHNFWKLIKEIKKMFDYLLVDIFSQKGWQWRPFPAFFSLNDYWYRCRNFDNDCWHNLEEENQRSITFKGQKKFQIFYLDIYQVCFGLWGGYTCLWFITEVSVYSELICLNKEKIRPNMQDHKRPNTRVFFIAFGGCKNPSLPLVCHRSKINLNFVCS